VYTDLETLCLDPRRTVAEAVKHMDLSRLGIVLLIDEKRHLVGTITDGDVRRTILANVDLSAPVNTLLRNKAPRYATPITAQAGVDRNVYLRLLQDNKILHLPILDEQQRVVGLVTLDEFLPNSVLPLQAVIMAGGAGTRLRPLTDSTPKPMLPVGDRPLMEIMIEQLRACGIRRVNVTTHHKSEVISDHFGDGRQFGVEIRYVDEDRPLGTAGSLGLLDTPQEPLLVINGDILTELDFRVMLTYHREHNASLTVAVTRYDLQVPYGIVECDGANIRGLTEKPQFGFFVNAGIYLLEPSVHSHIAAGERLDMTDVIVRLIQKGHPVVAFPIREYWLDIGRHADYEVAQEAAVKWSRQR
jgi:dTDP-glucose pyrophosphorylase/CBS domain-containing protein